MKILFTANRFPYPPYRGDKLKIFHLAKRLCKKHDLHLITFIQDKGDLKYLPELKKIFKEVHLVPLSRFQSYQNSFLAIFQKEPLQVRYFHSAAMKDKIKELKARHRYDVIHVQHLRMAQYWSKDKSVPRILDLPDAYSLYWKRRIAAKKNFLQKMFARIEQQRVFNYENILNEYNLSLVCSREDMRYLQTEKKIKNVSLLPNGVDLSTFSSKEHDYRKGNVILFTGNMDYAPNVDAVIYFSREIFPIIKKEVGDARFVIAGQRPVKKVLELANSDTTVTGFVKDLSKMYSAATIVVAPLRFGAGTQNKVLEAMAMGVPVVSRNIGFNGLNISSGEGVILALESRQFAEECIKLLKDERLRQKVGRKGKAVIHQQFDWDVIAEKLEGYFYGVIGG